MTEANKQVFDSFLAYEQARGARERGVKELRSPVRRFIRYLEEEGRELKQLDRAAARAYLVYIRSLETASTRSLASHTVRAYVQAAARFARYLVYAQVLNANPFSGLRLPRAPKTVLRNIPTEAEMEKILALLADWPRAGDDVQRQGRRYIAHLVAELQYSSGLRIAEVAALELGDLDFTKRRIYVRSGKKGKSRVAYISEYAAAILQEYCTRLRPLVLGVKQAGNPEKLFGCGYESLARSQNGHLASISKIIGMKIRSHTFRHALGYHLLRAGCPLRQIQEILGHEQIKDTEIYTKVDEREVQEVLDEYHPRGKEQLGNAP